MPEALQRSREEREDLYHFNSIGMDSERLYLLAHNWNQPSFALALSRRAALSGRAERQACFQGLGSLCHDFLPQGGCYWTLDSGGGALVRLAPDGAQSVFEIEGADGKAFPRGLAALGDKLVIAYSFWSEQRGARTDSRALLTVFDPASERFLTHHDLGNQGNSSAILVL